MADSSAENGPHQRSLPDERSIFDLIATNNLDAIRSLLNPLTLRDRQLIVYQKIGNKTLLCYACQLGFKDIVKYLLDECGADIDEGYCDSSVSVSPMHVAIRKLDVFLMTLLRNRGATVGNTILESVCVDHTFNTGYYTLMSILRLYKSRPNRSKLALSRSERIKYNGLFEFSWASELAYDIRSEDFLAASACGNVARMKVLLECGVNKNLKSNREENALCQAIMNEQENAVHFLINYRIYSIKSYVLALELCGAKFIVFRSENQKGLKCWRRSIKIRQGYRIGFADKIQMRLETDLGIEFQTEEEIDRLHTRYDGDLYLQALIVFLRILSRFSKLTHTAFVIVARHRIFKQDLLQPLKILSELYDLPSRPNDSIRCPTFQAVSTIAMLFRSYFLRQLDGVSDYLGGFGKLLDFLDSGTWEGLLRGGFEFYRIAYGEIMEIVLKYIYVMKRYKLSLDEKQWFETSVGEILQRCSYPYPSTLLHRAISGEFPLSVFTFLLKCSADANCTDAIKNTPLHLVSLLPRENSYLSPLTYLLIKAGAHVDSVNKFGIRPLEILKAKHVIKHPLKFISLQCLAAHAIHKHKIVLSEKTYPKILIRFVRLHSSNL